jgi:hypothetical protein
MSKILGMNVSTFHKLWIFYIGIQAAIWIKVFLFSVFFGTGISYLGQPSSFEFPLIGFPVFADAVQFLEYGFHQSMHLLIGIWMFLFAKNVKKVIVGEIAVWFFFAVILHNIGYWVFRAHPSLAFSAFDFISDYLFLWFFFILFKYGFPKIKEMVWKT